MTVMGHAVGKSDVGLEGAVMSQWTQPGDLNGQQPAVQALDQARGAAAHCADWATFHREILGPEGIVHKLFPGADDRRAFERTDEYREIQRLLNQLRENRPPAGEKEHGEPTKVITVRLPESVHHILLKEAESFQTSLNQLCITKLLQVLAEGEAPAR
jgi:predicted HicB family RNase H-like nuclease